MFKNLGPGAIGIRNLSLPNAIDLAKQSGFEGVHLDIREAAALVDKESVQYVRNLFESRGILPGSWSLPVAWRDDEQWVKDLEELPQLAAVGVTSAACASTPFAPPVPTSASTMRISSGTWHAFGPSPRSWPSTTVVWVSSSSVPRRSAIVLRTSLSTH